MDYELVVPNVIFFYLKAYYRQTCTRLTYIFRTLMQSWDPQSQRMCLNVSFLGLVKYCNLCPTWHMHCIC